MSQGEQGEAGEVGKTGAAGAAGAEGAVGRTGQQGEAGPASMLDPATASTIKRGLRTLMIATVVLYVVMVAFAVYIYKDSSDKRNDIKRVAITTNEALCAVRHNLQVRIDDSRAFLEEHPDGIPGITTAVIQQSIGNQVATVKSLAILRCPPE